MGAVVLLKDEQKDRWLNQRCSHRVPPLRFRAEFVRSLPTKTAGYSTSIVRFAGAREAIIFSCVARLSVPDKDFEGFIF